MDMEKVKELAARWESAVRAKRDMANRTSDEEERARLLAEATVYTVAIMELKEAAGIE